MEIIDALLEGFISTCVITFFMLLFSYFIPLQWACIIGIIINSIKDFHIERSDRINDRIKFTKMIEDYNTKYNR